MIAPGRHAVGQGQRAPALDAVGMCDHSAFVEERADDRQPWTQSPQAIAPQGTAMHLAADSYRVQSNLGTIVGNAARSA
jgi:hypothetical protein